MNPKASNVLPAALRLQPASDPESRDALSGLAWSAQERPVAPSLCSWDSGAGNRLAGMANRTPMHASVHFERRESGNGKPPRP